MRASSIRLFFLFTKHNIVLLFFIQLPPEAWPIFARHVSWAWLTLIVILLNTIDKELPDDRMTFLDPITKKPHSRLADAFVDDTMLGKSDSGDLSYEDLIGRLQLIAQTWERLLPCGKTAARNSMIPITPAEVAHCCANPQDILVADLGWRSVC